MLFSAVSKEGFMQYINGRRWIERSLQFLQEGCREEDSITWSEGYYFFLEEIFTVFNVACTREAIVNELLLLPVPYRDAIIRSLPVIIARDAFSVIDFFRQRYNPDLLLPTTTDERDLRSYYKPFIVFKPRRVVQYFLAGTKINYIDLFHLAVRSSNYLLLKKLVHRVDDITKSVFYRGTLDLDFGFAEEADDEDSYLINFFDYFLGKFGSHVNPEYATWDNIVLCVIDAQNEELLLHILSRPDCLLNFDVILLCMERSITPYNIGKILVIRHIELTKEHVDILMEKSHDYRFQFYVSTSDKNRRILEQIGGQRFMETFTEALLNEAMINLSLMSDLGMKGVVSIKKMELNAAVVKDTLKSGSTSLPDIYYNGEVDPKKKYKEYFFIEDFADKPDDLYVKTIYSLLHDPRSPYHNSYVVKARLELCDLNRADMRYLEQWMKESVAPVRDGGMKDERMKSLEQAFSTVSINKKRGKNHEIGWVPPVKDKKREPRNTSSSSSSSSSMSDYATPRAPSKSNKKKKKNVR